MANFNKCIFLGRLTHDPEVKTLQAGGKLAKLRFVVNNRKKQQSQWVDEPCYLDCEVWNRGETGKLADLVADRCKKGSQVMIEGKLLLDTWQDKTTGQNRTKHKLVVDNVQLLDARHAAAAPAETSEPQGESDDSHGAEIPF